MPHLSPLSWFIMPMILWFIYLIFAISQWWNFPPKISLSSSFSSSFSNNWYWE